MANPPPRAQASADGQPAPSYRRGHADTLRRILRRDRVLGEGEELPAPYFHGTGVREVSVVYFIRLPKGLHVVAKFDTSRRAKKEWAVIQELVRENVPSAMLPTNYRNPGDPLIWYRNDAGMGPVEAVWQLDQMVERQLAGSPGNCALAVMMGFDYLDAVHGSARLEEPTRKERSTGAAAGLLWQGVFPKLAKDQAWALIESGFRAAWPRVGTWLGRATANESSRERALEDCLTRLRDLRNKPVPKVAVARVHGDLNLTNMIVGLGSDRRALKTLVIDWADSEQNWVAAADFARAETWFWHGPFLKALARKDPSADPCATLAAVRDVLDGRARALPRPASPLAAESLEFVLAIRRKSLAVLKRDREDYLLNDLYHALAFAHLQAFTWTDLKDHPEVPPVALLGALLALQVVRDIDERAYAKGSPQAYCSPAAVAAGSEVASQPARTRTAQRLTISQPGHGSQAVGNNNVVAGKDSAAIAGGLHIHLSSTASPPASALNPLAPENQAPKTAVPEGGGVLIAYSARDERWLDALVVHLAPYSGFCAVASWCDTDVVLGTRKRPLFQSAIRRAKVAVLLVSPYFLATPFVQDEELRQWFAAAQKAGTSLRWVPVSTATFEVTQVMDYEPAIPTSRPLDCMNGRAEQNRALKSICQLIMGDLGSPTVSAAREATAEGIEARIAELQRKLAAMQKRG